MAAVLGPDGRSTTHRFSERLGRYRWVVERTFSWLLGCRRLGVRYERRAALRQGLLHLACGLLCLHFLAPVDG